MSPPCRSAGRVTEADSCALGDPADGSLRERGARRNDGRVLARLGVAMRPEQLSLPGFRLCPLEADLSGYWRITVRSNWRLGFRFDLGILPTSIYSSTTN